METKKIILCRGIQGSGKSTYAKKWVLEDPEHRVRFNNDDIRNMLGQYWVPNREDVVVELKKTFLITSMKKGYNIIIDNMNLNPKEVEFYENYVDIHNKVVEEFKVQKCLEPQDNFKYKLEFKDFFIPVEECIRRDAMRPNPIGEKVIRQTWNKYKHFIQVESVRNYVNNLLPFNLSNHNKTIILDMDSTLCFNTTGRPWYGPGTADGILQDEPNIPIIKLAEAFGKNGYYVFIITGRDKSLAKATESWLSKYEVYYSDIFYRKVGDFRKSEVIKKEIITQLYKKYNIEFIVDDSEPVVNMYREMGLTVLQPNKII